MSNLRAAKLKKLSCERDIIAMGYAGDVTCLDCFTDLQGNESSQLVDVRTSAEWTFVGVPDLSGLNKRPILKEWQTFPTMAVNEDFAETVSGQLKELGVSESDAIYFLCRSGVRSKAAAEALTQLGYSKAFNVIAGFEGGADSSFHRGNTDGWKFEGLPWKQN